MANTASGQWIELQHLNSTVELTGLVLSNQAGQSVSLGEFMLWRKYVTLAYTDDLGSNGLEQVDAVFGTGFSLSTSVDTYRSPHQLELWWMSSLTTAQPWRWRRMGQSTSISDYGSNRSGRSGAE